MSGIYDVTLAPGASERIPVVGVRAKVLSAPRGQVNVRVDGGDSYNLMEGQGVKKIDGRPFSVLTVRNISALAQTILVFVGDDSFEDTRVTGTVRVIDQGAEKALAGLQFFGSNTVSPAGGQGGAILMTANGGGGRNVAIKRMTAASTIAGSVLMLLGTSAGSLGYPAGAGSNKYAGQPDSTSFRQAGKLLAAASPSGAEITGVASYGVRIFVPANTPIEIPITTPIVLSGTLILAMSAEVLGRDLSITTDVEELT